MILKEIPNQRQGLDLTPSANLLCLLKSINYERNKYFPLKNISLPLVLAWWLSEPEKTGFFNSGMENQQEVVKKAVEEEPGDV